MCKVGGSHGSFQFNLTFSGPLRGQNSLVSIPEVRSVWGVFDSFFFFFFVFLPFLGPLPMAYGGSQARGLIRAVAASLRQSHSNEGSELRLRPTPQLTAMLDCYNPLSKGRDGSRNFMVPSRIH